MNKEELELAVVIKRILRWYVLAFIFVFVCLLGNQFLLLINFFIKNQFPISQKIMLLFYSIPSIIVMGAPFAACIGFVQGLAQINSIEKIAKDSKEVFIKKIVVPVLILGLVISALTFAVFDCVLPNANSSFANLYRTILLENDGNQPVLSSTTGPREMSSKMVIQGIKEIQIEKGNDFERKLNMWKLELNKKYSIPAGALFLSLFALSLSVIIKRHKKTGFCISVLACVLYWALLTYGQIFSTNNGKYGVSVMWLPNILFLCMSCVLYLCYKRIDNPPASGGRPAKMGNN